MGFFDRLKRHRAASSTERKRALLAEHSNLRVEFYPTSVAAFAERLRISPAIPAGRIRHESGDYFLFKQLVGPKKVRCLFE